MNDRLDDVQFYKMAMLLWNDCWNDTEILLKDVHGKEIAKQLIRAIGSISANIEEGYGKEYPQFLRLSRGSARESKGWYIRSNFLLSEQVIKDRVDRLESIIKMETKTIETLNQKLK